MDGIIDDLRLIGDEADCHAGRDFLLHFFDFRIQMLAKREVVSPSLMETAMPIAGFPSK